MQSNGSQTSFFDSLPSKSAFWLGFVTAILSLSTLGFIILGGQMLSGNSVQLAGDTTKAEGAPNPAPTAGGAPTNAPEPDSVPAGTVPAVTEDDNIRGNENAPVTIVEYSDFECPFCERFHPTLQQVMDEYGDDVRWVYRHFPLSFHPEAEPSANASECAAEQGKFWEFADTMFTNQDKLGDGFYKSTAANLGLNTSQFNDCVDSGKYLDKVRAQSQSGAAAGVTGTPGTFIIDADGNATPIRGALPYASVSAAIDQALQ